MEGIFNQFSINEINILIASIIADGEITKLCPGSRRKNNSYREHFGMEQKEYREWKESFFNGFLYIRPNSQYLVSKSDPLFTKLYPYFYCESGKKQIPKSLLSYCTHPLFLTVLYLDDGSLSITKRVNKKKRLIYLSPHIYLYLQNYPKNELAILQNHICNNFGFKFVLTKRKDGFGYVMKLTKVNESIKFLNLISEAAKECTGMEYKLDWEKRLLIETKKLNKISLGLR
ncbi:LAGLIDADG DNA endonuclease [Bacillus methanolicus]|uniref:LAGLIDADG DNA endonuclease n=1 Tax=Bacillus methanolicus (strain MGA3 / ATCC 53907) TaxID=796606 RepID=I3EAZ4_BACMM|nr:LAGLIDADG DNA endonuclease [Bacillus methanolicus]AIE61351.1 LAGLIDADG DNA endonuclease [Bacillus methanolicus MGA3]EIJ83665.1 LAGLIDADG DNA endonuclease [Bacillus methanolicus MGA3]